MLVASERNKWEWGELPKGEEITSRTNVCSAKGDATRP